VSALALDRDRAPTDEGERFVVVRIGAQWYAAPVAEVREIVKLPPVTEVPGAGAGVRGVVLIHGAVVTLLDPAPALGEPPAEDDARARALTVDHEGERLALRVDEVARIQVIPHANVEPAHELPCAAGAHVVGIARSVAPSPEGFVVLLDVGALVGAALDRIERFS
jgi:purine-binding chemotaxis protein CheW